jgi:hypothetical protein
MHSWLDARVNRLCRATLFLFDAFGVGKCRETLIAGVESSDKLFSTCPWFGVSGHDSK